MKPYPYQLEGLKALTAKLRFLLRDEPGLGKTCQLICATRAIKAKKILVVGLKSMVITWQNEIKMWGADLNNFTIINHDKLITQVGKKLLKEEWDVIIADESHQFLKNGTTQRAKVFAKLVKNTKFLWLATATVASRTGEDYYFTFKLLLPEVFGTWTKNQFREKYCNKVFSPYTRSGYSYEGFKNEDELNKILKACSIKRTVEEVALQLPELTETTHYLDTVTSSYTAEEIEDIKQRITEGKELTATYHLKLQVETLLKIPQLIEMLNNYPKETNIVIYAWHKKVVEEVVRAIKEGCADRAVDFISGEVTSSEKRQNIIDAFQNKLINTLVLNIQSGGAGITLTAATIGIYIQAPYSVIHWVQSRKRIHSIGSKKPVQIIKLVSKESIDEDIYMVLNQRAKFIKEVEG